MPTEDNFRKVTVHVPLELHSTEDVDGDLDKLNEIAGAVGEVVQEYVEAEIGTDVAATGETTVSAGWVPQDFNAGQLATIVDVIETALSDPDFIDTTSSGGASPELAEELRRDMRNAQATAQALLTWSQRSTR